MSVAEENVGNTHMAREDVSVGGHFGKAASVELNGRVVTVSDGDHVTRDRDFGFCDGGPRFGFGMIPALQAEFVGEIAWGNNAKTIVAVVSLGIHVFERRFAPFG